MMRKLVSILMILCAAVLLLGSVAVADESGLGEHAADRLLIATTTSVDATGLLDELKQQFEMNNSVDVQWVAVGTGIALEYGMNGDADLIMVHDRVREDKFIDEGYGKDRRVFGYNYFLIAGPESDPAGITGMSATEAFKTIAEKAPESDDIFFVSRGDGSGTHSREKAIWKAAGYNSTELDPTWYIEAGTGMVGTLEIADEKQAYTLCDSATWGAYKDQVSLVDLVTEGDDLLNVYAVIAVDPAKFPDIAINEDMATKWINFLISDETQDYISTFGEEKYGKPLFGIARGNAELLNVPVEETEAPVS